MPRGPWRDDWPDVLTTAVNISGLHYSVTVSARTKHVCILWSHLDRSILVDCFVVIVIVIVVVVVVVVGRRSSVVGRRSSVVGRRSSVVGRRSSVVGCRSLLLLVVIGCCRFLSFVIDIRWLLPPPVCNCRILHLQSVSWPTDVCH